MTPMQQKSDIQLAYEKFDLVLKKFSVAGAQEMLVKIMMDHEKDFIQYFQYGDRKQFNKFVGQA
jgi:hypothetical protein